MRIVNYKQFLSLPAGTVFYKFEPNCFTEFAIKDDSLHYGDFLYSPLTYPELEGDPRILDELVDNAEKSAPAHYWILARDGMFDEGQLFAVLEPADVASLIVQLTKALNDSGCSQEELVKLLGEASAAHTLEG